MPLLFLRCSRRPIGSCRILPFSLASFSNLIRGSGNHIWVCGCIRLLGPGVTGDTDDLLWSTKTHWGRRALCSQGTCIPFFFVLLSLCPSILSSFNFTANCLTCGWQGGVFPLRLVTLHMGSFPWVGCGTAQKFSQTALRQLQWGEHGTTEICSTLFPGIPNPSFPQ